MPIDTDVQSFTEENANITDCNTKLTQLSPLVLNTALTSADNNKIPVRRSGVWSIEGEEAYNGYYQDFGNISGSVVLTMNGDSCRTAMTATIIGNTFVTGFGANFATGVVYLLLLKQNGTGGYTVRWPYGASVLKQVGTNPDQMTEVYIVKLPSGKIFIKCEAFQNTTQIGAVIKEFEFPNITYFDSALAPMSFTWSKAPAVSYGGTLTGLYSDWEIADDVLYTNLLFSSYNNTTDLYAIQVVLTQAGTVYMRTRHGGTIGGTPVVSDWDEAVVELSGIDGDKYWDQTVLCINANKYALEGSRKIVDEKGGTLTLNGDTKVSNNATFSKWCGVVDGSGDTIGTNIGLNRIVSGTEWTIEGFFYTTGGSGNENFYGQALFGTSTTAGLNLLNVYFHELGGVLNGKIRIAYGNGSTYTNTNIAVSPSIEANTLYHIALVKQDSNLFLFVNGIKHTITSSFPAYLHTGNFRFFRGNSDTYPEYLKGGFTSIRVTKVARYTSDFQVDLTNPYFKTGNLWWTPEPKEIATDNFVGKADWDKVYHCLNFYGVSGSTSFTDLSNTPSQVSFFGNAQIGVSSDCSFLNLDGSGDYLTFPTSFNPNIPGWSIDVIIYPTSFSKVHSIIHMVTTGISGLHVHIDTSGHLLCNNGLVGTTAGNIQMVINTLYHITVKNVSGVIYGYINGVQCLTHTAQTYNIPTICYVCSANTQSYDFTGRIYSLKISQGETSFANFTPKTSANPYFITKPKVENWAETSLLINALDLPSGSTDIRDFKGNAISLYGDTKVSVDSNGLEYINFDGSGDYLTSPNSTDMVFGTGDFTVEAYFYPYSFDLIGGSTNRALLSKSISADGFSLLFSASGNIIWYTASTILTSTAALTADTLNHVAFVRISGVLYVYVNGVQCGSASYATNISATTSLYVGSSNLGNHYNGRIYSTRLTKGKALYTSNFAVDLTNPYFPAYENALADLWIDANDYSKITLATGVSKIIDKSGNMREVVQVATASQPALVQNAQNGLMALNFDGSNDSLSVAVPNIAAGKRIGLFFVAKWTTSDDRDILCLYTGVNTAVLIEAAPTNTFRFLYRNPAGTTGGVDIIPASNSVPVNVAHVMAAIVSSSGNTLHMDGTQIGSGSAGAVFTSDFTMAIGYLGSSAVRFLNGQIYEILSIPDLTDYWHKKVVGYSSHKWGLTDNLPANHPYKTGFPTEDSRTDDYWYATVLCINGTDIIRPTEIIDSSRNNKITVYGDAKALVDSNNKPYINFDGSGDYLTFQHSDAYVFGTNDFTIDVNFTPVSDHSGSGKWCFSTMYGSGYGAGTVPQWMIYSSIQNNHVSFGWYLNSNTVSSLQASNAGVVAGTQINVSVVRKSGVLYIFVNGVLKNSISCTYNFLFNSGGLRLNYASVADGGTWGTFYQTAKIYSVRVTKGIARYTEDFTVDLSNPYFPKNPPLWTPKEIQTFVWLDASEDENILLSSNKVKTWYDLSGNARHYTTTTPYNTYLSGKYVQFYNTSYILLPSTGFKITGVSSAFFAMFVVKGTQTVASCSDANSGTCLGSGGGQGCITYADQPPAGFGEAIGINGVKSVHHRPGVICATNNVTYSDSDFFVVMFVYSSSVSSIYINGEFKKSGVAFNQSDRYLSLGAGPYGNFGGYLCEHIMGNYVPNQDQIDRLFGYAAHKWDKILNLSTTLVSKMPGNHPYKNVAP